MGETKKNKFEERRVKRYILPIQELTRIFDGRVMIEGVSLPKDAFVGGVGIEHLYNAFVVFVFSDEFEPVPLHQEIPEGVGLLELRMYQFPEPESVPASSGRREFL